jgi:DNA-binding transcriptional LysR family regulator
LQKRGRAGSRDARRDDRDLGLLAGIDAPLLGALQALLETESVTEAARRLGSTQPRMSRTLARLRTAFGDPLLVPVGRRLERTARARELQSRIGRVLDEMRRLLAPAPPARPEEERRVVRIAASDYATAVVLQPWIRRLRREAPGIAVDIAPIGAATIDPLARGELDLAFAPRLPIPGMEQFVYRKILDDRMVCVVRKGHPRAPRGRLTLAAYLALEHVMVNNALPPISTVQAGLHRVRKSRTVAVRVPTFLSALRLVAASDLAAAVPERLVPLAGGDVVAYALPFSVEPIALQLLWHPRHTTEPFHRWVRDGILEAAGAR